jgi:RNA polymerase sigma-70 factor (ECF subfamily)
LPYFRGEARLSTWIYRIVVNVLSQERPDLATASLDEPHSDEERPRLQPAADDHSFEELVMKDRLQKAIERLPVQYQVLINGHYMKGLRYEELAEALDLPMGTVKTHLHRAKRRLRLLLDTEYR